MPMYVREARSDTRKRECWWEIGDAYSDVGWAAVTWKGKTDS